MNDKLDTFFKYVKDQIFTEIKPPSEYEKRLKQIVKNKNWVNMVNLLQVFVVVAALLSLKNIFRVGGNMLFVYAVIFGIIIALFFILNIFKRKHLKAKHLLLKAIESIRKSRFSEALDFMLDAYQLSKDEELLNVIKDFTATYPPNPEQDIRITELTLKKSRNKRVKDKKLQEILDQIKNVSDYILKHKEIIANSFLKIKDLKNNVTNTRDERLRSEYAAIINRYEAIIDLENSKIEFYSKAKDELLKLKENHLITQKLLLEKQQLRDLEDSLLEKSIKESYDSGIDDFINYETAYLEAISEYSEQISSSGDHNLFEDVIRSFNDKTEFL